jgi:hypothetical protein
LTARRQKAAEDESNIKATQEEKDQWAAEEAEAAAARAELLRKAEADAERGERVQRRAGEILYIKMSNNSPLV